MLAVLLLSLVLGSLYADEPYTELKLAASSQALLELATPVLDSQVINIATESALSLAHCLAQIFHSLSNICQLSFYINDTQKVFFRISKIKS